jgi:hypothetical protein
MEPAQFAAAQIHAMHEHEKFMHDFKQKMKDFDEGLKTARSVSREAIYKIVLLSGSIVGFSATIQSIQNLKISTNIEILRVSWILFLVVVALGPLMNIIESRVAYIIVWRGLQPQKTDWKHLLRLRGKISVFLTLLYSLAFSPRNLIFCRQYKNESIADLRQRQNGMMIATANLLINFVLFLESVFLLLFFAALVCLVLSVSH